MNNDNYTIYHLHSDISNLTAGTSADSITKYQDYVERAEELGMRSMAISEHGNVINWIRKKQTIEKAGMKYIHANEIYLTKNISKDHDSGKLILGRDNFHYMLIGKNYDGVKEINQLTSNSYKKEDGHFYYNPRITFDELKSTSDNIIMTSACLASPIWRLYNKAYNQTTLNTVDVYAKRELEDLLNWMESNKHRMFFEIQYHNHPQQIAFNQLLLNLSSDLKIPLIAGTDTHSLNDDHARARSVFLKSKGANYGDEGVFDLTMKSYDELVEKFKDQNALPRNIYLEAIHNTNVMADMVEEFELDKTPKYPKMYDKPIEVFQKLINEGVKKRGIDKFEKKKRKEYFSRIKEEFDTYVKLDTIDYMLLQKNIIDWCHTQEIYQGYGRGSVNGSLIAYVLGITEMDSIKHKLNFFRFLNPDRISLPDIDIDFPVTRRQEVIDYLASLDGIDFAEIITLNTKALKGSIRLVGKGLDMPLNVVDEISKAVESFDGKDRIDDKWRKKYPELFEYVDLMNGVVESMGSHPSGFVVSPIDLDTHVSTVYTKESKYRVTAVNMKELDGENYVKLDILGVMNVEIVNEACRLSGIQRLTPDNMDTTDIDVWKSLRESTLGIFQIESESAHAYVKQLFSDDTLANIERNVGKVDYIDLLSMANGAIRPSGKSYRDQLARGATKDNGHVALDKLLSPTLGYLVFQEQIMNFLTEFCEHGGAEADSVRRGLSKKEGTEQFLPKIRDGFIKFMKENHNETEEHAELILESFLEVIHDASKYAFSVNHSSPYSYIGYAGAWLRYYYPLEFLTVALNLQDDKKEKTTSIMAYIKSKGYKVNPISFGNSRATYSFNKEEGSIYKGIASIAYLSAKVAEELYDLSQSKDYDKDDFVGLLIDIFETSINRNQMEILIRLDFFKKFGTKEALLEIYMTMSDNKKADTDKYPQFKEQTVEVREVVRKKVRSKKKKDKKTKHFTWKYYKSKKKKVLKRVKKAKSITKCLKIKRKEKIDKKLMKYSLSLKKDTRDERIKNIRAYEKAVRANPPKKIELYDQINFEKINLGYAISTFPEVDNSYAIVLDVNQKYTPLLTLYRINNGEEIKVKVAKKKFYTNDDGQFLYVGDVIKIASIEEKSGWKYVDGDYEKDESKKELHLNKCKVVRPSSRRQIS